MILVVAPDEQLRRSIAFALEAEGMPVRSLAQLGKMDTDDLADARCAVIDETAVLSDGDGWGIVAALPIDIVLLVDRMRHIPERYAAHVVRKPLLGRKLIDAVMECG